MQPTYLFYDIESSGLNKCFDQVVQFAAIRTDMAFNELERHEFLVKLNPDTIPAPGAVITHHVSIEQANTGISELEAVEVIHRLLNEPGTISLGYNTLAFDDEFLRFSFWRNLLTPYTHQFANQCGRMDIYPITVLYRLFKPDTILWPEKEGKISLKLENISALNQLAEGSAHNALVDVLATVALAKKLAAEKDMWAYCQGYFKKATDQERLNKLPSVLEVEGSRFLYGLMVLGKFGNRDQFQAPVLGLGQHLHYKNQTLWLRLDMPGLNTITQENLADYLVDVMNPERDSLLRKGKKADVQQDNPIWVIRKKYGEPGMILPPGQRFQIHLSDGRKKVVADNIQWCKEQQQHLMAIAHYYRDFKYPTIPDTDVDAALYQADFMTPQEQTLSRRFHLAKADDKVKLISQFTDPNYREMALRVIGRHFPDTLSDKQQALFQDYLAQVYTRDPATALIDFRGAKRFTLTDAENDLTKIRQQIQLSAERQALLQELAEYYQTLAL